MIPRRKKSLKLDTNKILESAGVITKSLEISGESKHKSDESYNPDELWVGVQIEKEHHHDEGVAKEIAKDHLEELPDYYTRLLKMEMEAGHKFPKEYLERLNIT